MSKCVVSTGVVDNDPEGKGGRGTVYWMTIEHDEGIERYEYGLLEMLSGKFDREAIIAPYRDAAEIHRKKVEAELLEAKKKELEDRKTAVAEDPLLDPVLTEVIEVNPTTIADYKRGKEQALNFMVGQVIKLLKARKISYADGAFGISELLKKRIA